jgi:ribonuclease J
MSNIPLKVIPLGGLGEIGKNMLALEYDGDIVVIDAGISFPGEDLPGINLVIPDISYLVENASKVRGIVITHGHEDHTGALPFVLDQLDVPVYAPRLAEGLISAKLKGYGKLKNAQLEIAAPGVPFDVGVFTVESFRVCHSIPDSTGLIVRYPGGAVIHTGDFKFDHTPVDGRPADLSRLAQLGDEGVQLLLSDSTYAELPGYTPSEQTVGETLRQIMGEAEGRVIVATFASLVSRVQQVIDAAVANGRKVCVEGRSMVETVNLSEKLGYLDVPEGTLIRLDDARKLPPNQVTIVLTGTQGEPSSALSRIANREHKHIEIEPKDTVVMSASPIPGNQGHIGKTIDNLFRLGANVLYGRIRQVHVHGHASQEELKLMLGLTRPRFFVPIHGEHRHQVVHTRLAQSMGVDPDNTFVLDNGDVLEISEHEARITDRVQAGPVYLDGSGRWETESKVLKDRRKLARYGFVIITLSLDKATGKVSANPEVVTQGFAEDAETPALIEGTHRVVAETVEQLNGTLTGANLKSSIKSALKKYYQQETKRRPIILPIVVEG